MMDMRYPGFVNFDFFFNLETNTRNQGLKKKQIEDKMIQETKPNSDINLRWEILEMKVKN